jgi:hypothetical protein
MIDSATAGRLPFSQPLAAFAIVTAGLVCLTSSFDIFLVIQLGGNFRLCQLFSLLLVLLAMTKGMRYGFVPTLGLAPAGVWLCFQIAFVPATPFWPKSIGYCLWLVLNLATLFAFTQIFGTHERMLRPLLRWYAWSFGFVAGFGVLQFLLPLLGFSSPLVQQWWIAGALPRANGFSYEPSYFATYLLIGSILANGLRRAKSPLLTAWESWTLSILCAVGILLSSSRMGIIFLLIEIALPMLRPWGRLLWEMARLRISNATIRALLPATLGIGIFTVLGTISVLSIMKDPAVLLMLLNGTGVSDTAAHSVLQREGALEDTLTVFTQHPLIGRSLGGVSSAIADLHGETISSFEDSKLFEGMSVFAEILAASGCLGMLPFAWFLVVTIRAPLRLSLTRASLYTPVLQALVRATVFAWLILQFNQNVLRPYLWIHLSILASVYSVVSRDRAD